MHRGKSAVLNHVVNNIAKGEIIVFNDATTIMEKDSLKKIGAYFSDKIIGAVAGRLIFRKINNSSISQNHSLYWRYEELLRESESKAGCLPFVSGAFYAIRRKLYTTVPENLPDDSVSPLGIYKQGHRVVYAKDAVAYEEGAGDSAGEFKIKVRGVIRELSSIFYFKELLIPFKYPLLSLILISHRLLRWAVPVFLTALFFVNISLFEIDPYRIFLYIQLLFYLMAVSGLFLKTKFSLISIPFYFSLINIAAFCGIIKFLKGHKQSTWTSVR